MEFPDITQEEIDAAAMQSMVVQPLRDEITRLRDALGEAQAIAADKCTEAARLHGQVQSLAKVVQLEQAARTALTALENSSEHVFVDPSMAHKRDEAIADLRAAISYREANKRHAAEIARLKDRLSEMQTLAADKCTEAARLADQVRALTAVIRGA